RPPERPAKPTDSPASSPNWRTSAWRKHSARKQKRGVTPLESRGASRPLILRLSSRVYFIESAPWSQAYSTERKLLGNKRMETEKRTDSRVECAAGKGP